MPDSVDPESFAAMVRSSERLIALLTAFRSKDRSMFETILDETAELSVDELSHFLGASIVILSFTLDRFAGDEHEAQELIQQVILEIQRPENEEDA